MARETEIGRELGSAPAQGDARAAMAVIVDQLLLAERFGPDHEALAAVRPQACDGADHAACIDLDRSERSAAGHTARPAGDRRAARQQRGGAKNYKLMEVADADAGRGRDAWLDLVPHSADVFIEGFKPFDNFIAIEERRDGNKLIRLLDNEGKSKDVASDEAAYSMGIDANYEVASTDEVAEVIRWLAVDAPASATGTVIDVNGASYVR
jgi:hypothetical protein